MTSRLSTIRGRTKRQAGGCSGARNQFWPAGGPDVRKNASPKKYCIFLCTVWASSLGRPWRRPQRAQRPVSALSFLVPFHRFDSLLVCLLVWEETKSICALLKMLVEVGQVCSFLLFIGHQHWNLYFFLIKITYSFIIQVIVQKSDSSFGYVNK